MLLDMASCFEKIFPFIICFLHFMEVSLKFNAFAPWDMPGFPLNVINILIKKY